MHKRRPNEAQYDKRYYERHRGEVLAKSREYRLRTKYGISSEQYEEILAQQNGGCAICGRKPKSGKRLAVDHKHGGKTRGLLCFICNYHIVGFLERHKINPRKVVEYLEAHESTSV